MDKLLGAIIVNELQKNMPKDEYNPDPEMKMLKAALIFAAIVIPLMCVLGAGAIAIEIIRGMSA
jgi:hypothetical protein